MKLEGFFPWVWSDNSIEEALTPQYAYQTENKIKKGEPRASYQHSGQTCILEASPLSTLKMIVGFEEG